MISQVLFPTSKFSVQDWRAPPKLSWTTPTTNLLPPRPGMLNDTKSVKNRSKRQNAVSRPLQHAITIDVPTRLLVAAIIFCASYGCFISQLPPGHWETRRRAETLVPLVTSLGMTHSRSVQRKSYHERAGIGDEIARTCTIISFGPPDMASRSPMKPKSPSGRSEHTRNVCYILSSFLHQNLALSHTWIQSYRSPVKPQ